MLKDKYYLFLFTCSVLFGLGLSINQKSIQSQLFSIIQTKQIIYIGCILALGNLFSSSGAKFFYEYVTKKFPGNYEFLVLSILLILSYALMGSENVISVIIGFMVINLFKGCYKPLLSAEMVNAFPFKRSLSTNTAIMYSLSIACSSLLQYFLSYVYENPEKGNIVFAFFTAFVVIPAFLVTKLPSSWAFISNPNKLSGKQGIIEKKNGKIEFIQIYSVTTSPVQLERLSKIVNLGRYPVLPIQFFKGSRDSYGLQTTFLGDIHLSDITDCLKQYEICQSLLALPNVSCSDLTPACIPSEYHIFPPKILSILKTETQLCQNCLIHGDLHPENIMVLHEAPYVIDWDFSGIGPLWYDLLSLLSHPYLYFDKNLRYKLFLQFCDLSSHNLDLLFYFFCQYKERQLSRLEVYDAKFNRLAKSYAFSKAQYNC